MSTQHTKGGKYDWLLFWKNRKLKKKHETSEHTGLIAHKTFSNKKWWSVKFGRVRFNHAMSFGKIPVEQVARWAKTPPATTKPMMASLPATGPVVIPSAAWYPIPQNTGGPPCRDPPPPPNQCDRNNVWQKIVRAWWLKWQNKANIQIWVNSKQSWKSPGKKVPMDWRYDALWCWLSRPYERIAQWSPIASPCTLFRAQYEEGQLLGNRFGVQKNGNQHRGLFKDTFGASLWPAKNKKGAGWDINDKHGKHGKHTKTTMKKGNINDHMLALETICWYWGYVCHCFVSTEKDALLTGIKSTFKPSLKPFPPPSKKHSFCPGTGVVKESWDIFSRSFV